MYLCKLHAILGISYPSIYNLSSNSNIFSKCLYFYWRAMQANVYSIIFHTIHTEPAFPPFICPGDRLITEYCGFKKGDGGSVGSLYMLRSFLPQCSLQLSFAVFLLCVCFKSISFYQLCSLFLPETNSLNM